MTSLVPSRRCLSSPSTTYRRSSRRYDGLDFRVTRYRIAFSDGLSDYICPSHSRCARPVRLAQDEPQPSLDAASAGTGLGCGMAPVDDPWGSEEPPLTAGWDLPPLPERFQRFAALTGSRPLSELGEEPWVWPSATELAEVVFLAQEGWVVAPDVPFLAFLPAIWPPEHRGWVPDRVPRVFLHWAGADGPRSVAPAALNERTVEDREDYPLNLEGTGIPVPSKLGARVAAPFADRRPCRRATGRPDSRAGEHGCAGRRAGQSLGRSANRARLFSAHAEHAHFVRNETTEPVTFTVLYYDLEPGQAGRADAPAPAGCADLK